MSKIRLLFLLLIFFSFIGCQKIAQPENKACFRSQCFSVELATTTGEQITGLMNSAQLPDDQGMLFVYVTPKKYPIWMLNMQFPLDIVWLDKDKKVVFIKANAQPCSDTKNCEIFTPDANAKYVLELNASTVATTGLTVDDVVEIDL